MQVGADDAGEWVASLPRLFAAWAGGAVSGDEGVLRLATQSPEHRAAFLDLAARELAAFPFERVHPGWLARHLPADVCLQHWALQTAPAAQRAELVRLRPVDGRPERAGSLVEPTGPPAWFAAWWSAELRTRLGWPDPLPWQREDPHPLARLGRLGEEPTLAALDAIGARVVAAAIHQESPQQLVASLFAFPETVRQRLVALVRERGFPPEVWWGPRWLGVEGTAPERLRRLALAELAAIARCADRRADGRRLALALPPELGEHLIADLDDQALVLAEPLAERLAKLEGDLAVVAAAPSRSLP
jgi:hypothetical protein